jgi:hypothetical protein
MLGCGTSCDWALIGCWSGVDTQMGDIGVNATGEAGIIGWIVCNEVGCHFLCRIASYFPPATAHPPFPPRHSSSTFKSASTRSRAYEWISSRCKVMSPTSHSRGFARLQRAGDMKCVGRYHMSHNIITCRLDGQTGCRRLRSVLPALYSSPGNPSSS